MGNLRAIFNLTVRDAHSQATYTADDVNLHAEINLAAGDAWRHPYVSLIGSYSSAVMPNVQAMPSLAVFVVGGTRRK